MNRRIRDTLDDCLAALLSGEATLEECLESHPEHAAELRPLLEVAERVRQVQLPVCDQAAFAAGKRSMLRALNARHQARAPRRRSGLALPGMIAATATVALIALLGVLVASWQGATVQQEAALANASGVVQVLPDEGESWRDALVGERFASGARIRTGASASAVLAFFDGSATWLEPDTEVALAEMTSRRDGGASTTRVFQHSGETFTRVDPLPDANSSFQIETSSAVAAVRGTEFAVRVRDTGETQVAVSQGAVRVTARQVTVEVRALQETTILPAQEPELPCPAAQPLPTPVLPLPEELPPSPTATARPQPAQPTPTAEPAEPTPTAQPATHTPEPEVDKYDRTPEPVDLRRTPERLERTRTPQGLDDRPTVLPTPTGRQELPAFTRTPMPIHTVAPVDSTRTPQPVQTIVPVDSTKTPQGVSTRTPKPTPKPTPEPIPKPTPEPVLEPTSTKAPRTEPAPTAIAPARTETPPAQLRTRSQRRP
jgi:ferric-dicitrate binding protein FerR (iron transport regulator)